MTEERLDPARRKALVVRFFVVHMLAYVVAFPWGVAGVPAVFAWKEPELLALGDERDAVVFVLERAIVPAVVAFLLPHGLGLPWVLAARRGADRGWLLFAIGSALLCLAGVAAAVAAWVLVLRG